MILLSVSVLAICTCLQWKLGRSVLYPPATLSCVWTVVVLGLLLCGDLYFPLSGETIVVVISGVLAFSGGGAAALCIRLHGSPPVISYNRTAFIKRGLDCGLALIIGNIPFFWMYLTGLSGLTTPRENLWKQIRIATFKTNTLPGGGPFNLEATILPFFSVFAFISVFEYARTGTRRWRTFITVVVAALYQILRGARSDVLLLLISAVVILWVCRRRSPTKLLTITAVAFCLIFMANQLFMSKFGASANNSIGSNLPKLEEGLATYVLGGTVAFDQNLRNHKVPNWWKLNKFAIRIANKFGAEWDEPPRHLKYTNVSPFLITNVYTIYFAFDTDYGFGGVVGFMLALGFLSTIVYRKALRGFPWAVLLFGSAVYGTVMTLFSEEFFAQATFWLKIILAVAAVYAAPPLSSRFIPRPDCLEAGACE